MSDILKSVHKTAKGLSRAGAIDKTTMRKFDALCLTSIHEFHLNKFANYDWLTTFLNLYLLNTSMSVTS
ncbi:MAG: hypothetical protein ABJE79_12150 [Marinomonas sp.]